jgi:hypothetical protein
MSAPGPTPVIPLCVQSSLDDYDYARDDLCSQCASIDFVDMFTGKRRSESMLFSRLYQGQKRCPMCYFLLSSIHDFTNPPTPEEDERLCLVAIHISTTPPIAAIRLTTWRREGKTVSRSLRNGCSDSENSPPFLRAIRSDSIDFASLRRQIAWCASEHSISCGQEVSSDERTMSRALRNFKVIDCKRNAVVTAPPSCNYAALSYVWGPADLPPLTSSGGSPGQQQFHLSSDNTAKLPFCVPKTVADAMEVVQRLGMQYLWVDKYCIDQANKSEMHTQLSAMDTIYASAQVTIVATGENASFGLPGVTSTPRNIQPRITVEGRTYLLSLHDWIPVETSPWSSRAWTYQEGLCSRRRLYFTFEQVIYECNTAEVHEALNAPLSKTSVMSTSHFRGGLEDHYSSLATHITQYTKRELSHQGDVLNAMRGIFARYARFRVPVPQYWGIPAHPRAFHRDGVWMNPYNNAENTSETPTDPLHVAFSYGLLWSLNGVPHARRRLGFPTWSWAGWIAPVKWSEWEQAFQYDAFDFKHMFDVAYRRRNLAKVKVGITDVTLQVVDKSGNIYPLAEAIMQLATSSNSKDCVDSFPVLRIQAEVISVRLSTSPTAIEAVFKGYGETYLGPVIHATHASYGELSREQYSSCAFWLLTPTPEIAASKELSDAIRNDTFDCIVLDKRSALVVWGRGDVKERIGTIDLVASLRRGWLDSVATSSQIACLRNGERCQGLPKINLRSVAPCERRAILVG